MRSRARTSMNRPRPMLLIVAALAVGGALGAGLMQRQTRELVANCNVAKETLH